MIDTNERGNQKLKDLLRAEEDGSLQEQVLPHELQFIEQLRSRLTTDYGRLTPKQQNYVGILFDKMNGGRKSW